MKTNIHPKWYPEAKVTCACGNTFTIGATVPELTVEVCSACHPFYTGEMKFVGSAAGRVEAFLAKQQAAKGNKMLSKTQKRKLKREKRIREEMARPDTLSEVRQQS